MPPSTYQPPCGQRTDGICDSSSCVSEGFGSSGGVNCNDLGCTQGLPSPFDANFGSVREYAECEEFVTCSTFLPDFLCYSADINNALQKCLVRLASLMVEVFSPNGNALDSFLAAQAFSTFITTADSTLPSNGISTGVIGFSDSGIASGAAIQSIDSLAPFFRTNVRSYINNAALACGSDITVYGQLGVSYVFQCKASPSSSPYFSTGTFTAFSVDLLCCPPPPTLVVTVSTASTSQVVSASNLAPALASQIDNARSSAGGLDATATTTPASGSANKVVQTESAQLQTEVDL
eukprot:gene6074-2674_t